MAPVDVFEDACQDGAPLAIPWQLQSTSYKQGSIVDSPSKALKVAGVIQIYLQHFQSVALLHDVLVPQGVAMHGGHLKAHDALQLMLPVLLCHVGECPPKPPLEDCFKPTGNNQYTLMQ